MLEEALKIIRRLFEGGLVNYRGRYYTVENARLYSLPDEPPPIIVSAFGHESTDLAARIGDGYVNTSPEAPLLERYREGGGKGPTVAAVKICWATDEGTARKLAFDRWKSSGLAGSLNQELAFRPTSRPRAPS